MPEKSPPSPTRPMSMKPFSNYIRTTRINFVQFAQVFLYSPFHSRCKVCEIHFLSPNCLDRHIKQSHEMKEFKCQHLFCVESFTKQQSLDEHFLANHSRKECPHCKKMILETYIAQHIKDRHDVDKRGIICELCGKFSLNKQMHKAHYQTIHNDSEKLQCDICGRWYEWIRNHVWVKWFFSLTHFSGTRIENRWELIWSKFFSFFFLKFVYLFTFEMLI